MFHHYCQVIHVTYIQRAGIFWPGKENTGNCETKHNVKGKDNDNRRERRRNRMNTFRPSNWSSANSGDELWILQVLLDIATLLNPMQLNAKIQIALFYYLLGTITILIVKTMIEL